MWLMDDDCEPDSHAVAELVAAAAIVGEDAVLGGNIVDLNGESVNVQPISHAARSERRATISSPFGGRPNRNEHADIRFIPRFGDLVRKAGSL